MSDLTQRIQDSIRDIPDFPIEGIIFKDITPVLSDVELFSDVIDDMARRFEGEKIDAVVGMESRGFLFGAPLAMKLGAAFVPARKPGKLPYESVKVEYALEYGTNTLEMHVDAVKEGQRVLIVDDLLATGGTAKATCDLVQQLGAEVAACLFMVELGFLSGRDALGGVRIESQVVY
jgi:adenine phosphoribosyltransferase